MRHSDRHDQREDPIAPISSWRVRWQVSWCLRGCRLLFATRQDKTCLLRLQTWTLKEILRRTDRSASTSNDCSDSSLMVDFPFREPVSSEVHANLSMEAGRYRLLSELVVEGFNEPELISRTWLLGVDEGEDQSRWPFTADLLVN